MKRSTSLLFTVLATSTFTFACVDDPVDGDEVAEDDSDSEGGEDLDSDEDGLTDLQEAEYGTDPNKKDTDGDNYWDSWEITEGSDPLDPASRIYQGFWPYSPSKDTLEQGSFGVSTTAKGSPFPRAEFQDQYGDSVDVYDFANFDLDGDGQKAFFIADMSAMWCGPCHTLANWVAGVPDEGAAYFEQSYPSVPGKVHDHVIWWLTFVVEAQDGSPPTLSDSQSWFMTHPDPKIPVLVDDTQGVRNLFNGGQYPFLFLLDPELKVEYWKYPTPSDNAYQALFYVEAYL